MNKPTKRGFKPVYDYHELVHYIENKIQKDLRDYGNRYGRYTNGVGNKEAPYLDFWHWMLDDYMEIHNGCFSYVPLDAFTDGVPEGKEWVAEILEHFKEFADENGELDVWIEW